MTDARSESVERTINARASVIFDFLADPANHPRLDGSGMVRAHATGSVIAAVGDRFTMRMRMGTPYRSTSTVVEFERDRCLAWRPVMYVLNRRLLGGQRWRYELEPRDADTTLVRETYVWGEARGAAMLRLAGFPARMRGAMRQSLQNLSELVESEHS